MSTLTTITATSNSTMTSTITQKSQHKQATLVMKQQKMATHVQKSKTSTIKTNKKKEQTQNKKKSVSLPNTPTIQQQQQNKRNVLPVKARRVERRKEIKSMTEEATLPLSESSSSSDDNSSSKTQITKKKKKKCTVKKVTVDIRDTIYAGPTFNNAPAPSALPLPFVFTKRKEDLSRHSKDLMNILSPQQSNFERDLSEIQRGLRHMLKI